MRVCQRLVSAVVISEVVIPAPKARQIRRNGASVIPVMGASTNGLGSVKGPIARGSIFTQQILPQERAPARDGRRPLRGSAAGAASYRRTI